MLCWLIDESAGHFWWPAEFENVANPYFEHLKQLQNPGHLRLTKSSMFDSLIEGCVPYLVSLETYFQAYHPGSSIFF